MDAVQGNAKKVLEALEPTEVFSMFYQRSDVFVRALLSVMPSSDKGEILVRTVGRLSVRVLIVSISSVSNGCTAVSHSSINSAC